jgi:hypothetical protein
MEKIQVVKRFFAKIMPNNAKIKIGIIAAINGGTW